MPALTGSAPAKINLGLRILNRRADGYHELRTIFQTISLADRLTVSYSAGEDGGVQLTCNRPELETDENLARIAAQRFLEAGRLKGAVRIVLEKRIPVAAGLGGGSSDAAAVLLALRRLRPRGVPSQKLHQIAAEIGSDVPFFLIGGTAAGAGRGQELSPLPDPPRCWLVVVAPEIAVSTKTAYQALRNSRPRLTVAQRQHIINGFRESIGAFERAEALDLTAVPPNDFESVVFSSFPELQRWKQRLLEQGASLAMLSGSGSAVFGVFPNRPLALRARRSLREFSGEVFVTNTLARRPYESIWRR